MRLGGLALTLPLSGCTTDVESGLRSVDQAAAVANDYFSRGGWESPGEMHLCFIQQAGESYDTTFAATIQQAIEWGWANAIGLDLEFEGPCPAGFPREWVSIFMKPIGSFGGAAEGGVGGRQSRHANWDNRNDVQVALGTTARSTIQHEFGHVLGFYHEHQRLDAEPCIEKEPPTHTIGWLTDIDEDSIMSYCSYVTPSPLDLLAAETLYPKNYQRDLRCLPDASGCFNLGNGVVFSGHADGVAGADWYVRGRGHLLLSFELLVDKPGTDLVLEDEVSAADVSSGTTSVAISTEDIAGRLHSSTRTIRKSASLYSSILTAML